MRDVLVEQLDWAEDDARAFLDVLFAPVENLATKDDVEVVRVELLAAREELLTVRNELRGEINGVRDELRGDINGVRDDLKQYIDQRLAELAKQQDERERRIYAEVRSMVRAAEVRMLLLFTGGFGTVIGLLLERT